MFAKPRATRATAVLVTVLAIIGVASCSDDDAPSSAASTSIEQIRDATFAAASARYQGEVRFSDGTSGSLQGIAAADPAQGAVTLPLQTLSGVQDVELTWVDGVLYVRRAVGTATPGAPGTVGVFLRSASDRPWVRLPAQGLGQTLLSPYDPFTFLEQLTASAAVAVRPDGSESVDGRTLDRYVAEAQGEGATLAPGIRSTELLTDQDHRLVRARLIGEHTIEYTLSDYGTDVSVAAPPDDQIAAPVVTDNSEDPAGAYEQVATGTIDGIAWQLMRAPATNDGSCWRLDVQAESDPIAPTEPDGATCLAPIDPTVDEPVLIVADAGLLAPFEALAAVLPSGSQAVLRFADRSSRPVAVDPRGFLVWVGPKEPMLVVLDVTLPDGSQEECGPGSVSTLDDLDGLPPDQVPQLRGAPWLCLPA